MGVGMRGGGIGGGPEPMALPTSAAPEAKLFPSAMLVDKAGGEGTEPLRAPRPPETDEAPGEDIPFVSSPMLVLVRPAAEEGGPLRCEHLVGFEEDDLHADAKALPTIVCPDSNIIYVWVPGEPDEVVAALLLDTESAAAAAAAQVGLGDPHALTIIREAEGEESDGFFDALDSGF